MSPAQFDAKVAALAAVFAHFIPNLDGRDLLDAFLHEVGNDEDAKIVRLAWSQARVKRDLAQRGLELPDYSLRGIA